MTTTPELTTPERIPAKHTQLPKGWKLIRREDGEDVIMHPEAGAVGRMSFGDAFAAALQGEGMGEVPSPTKYTSNNTPCDLVDDIGFYSREYQNGNIDQYTFRNKGIAMFNAFMAATHPPASANPVTPSAENVVRQLWLKFTNTLLTDEQVHEGAALIQAHTDAVYQDGFDLGASHCVQSNTSLMEKIDQLESRNAALEEALNKILEEDATTPTNARAMKEFARQALANKEASHE